MQGNEIYEKIVIGFNRVYYSFPIQLVILHFKRNLALILIWIFTASVIYGLTLSKYGAQFLFLAPEYFDQTDYKSFFIMGFAYGGFVMAFNLYSYLGHVSRFPFIAIVKKPFSTFCLNNFIIPGAFLLLFFYKIYQYQVYKELESVSTVMGYFLAFIIGLTLFILIALVYFVRTNKDVFQLTGKTTAEELEKLKFKKIRELNAQQSISFDHLGSAKNLWKILTYMDKPWSVKLARDLRHYDATLLNEVMEHNFTNARLFEIVTILSFVALGTLSKIDWLNLPAGASFFLLLTIIMMLISAISSWFKGWTSTMILIIYIAMNFFANDLPLINFRNEAFGLNYERKVEYSVDRLDKMSHDFRQHKSDSIQQINILNLWKKKQGQEKPKLIIINSSGGGLRSALWSYTCLSYLDSLADGNFENQIAFMTGASGGVIGSAYYREVKRRHLNCQEDIHFKNISKDILNSVGYSLATRDLFFRFQKVNDDSLEYPKDRGFAFEKALNENTNFVFNQRLSDYQEEESKMAIPQMFFTPTIVNDGRRLCISTQGLSFLSKVNHAFVQENYPSMTDMVDYQYLFKRNNANHIKYSSVLRMNATFPYILPIVSLPTKPEMKIMDAGVRDNFGSYLSLKYIHYFKDWIKENTSGVIIIQLRDNNPVPENITDYGNNIGKRITLPANAVIGNFTKTQEYINNELLLLAQSWLDDVPFHIYDLNLEAQGALKISLSWHLSTKEKNNIRASILSEENQKIIYSLPFISKK